MGRAQLNDEQLMRIFGFGERKKEDWIVFCNDTMAWMLMKHPTLVEGPQKQPVLFRNCVQDFIDDTGPHRGPVQAADTNRGDIIMVDIIHSYLKSRSKYIRNRVNTPAHDQLIQMARKSVYADLGATPPKTRSRAQAKSTCQPPQEQSRRKYSRTNLKHTTQTRIKNLLTLNRNVTARHMG